MSLAKLIIEAKAAGADVLSSKVGLKIQFFQKRSTSKIDLLRMITEIEKITLLKK